MPGAKLSYRHEAWWCHCVDCWLLAVRVSVSLATNYTCCAHSLLQAPGQNLMFRNDLPYPPTSCGSLAPPTSCGSLVLPTSCDSLVPSTSCSSLVPPTSCGNIIPPSSSGNLAPSTSCGPGPSHPLLPNPSMMQGDVQFPPVTSSSATPPLTGRSVPSFFGSQY